MQQMQLHSYNKTKWLSRAHRGMISEIWLTASLNESSKKKKGLFTSKVNNFLKENLENVVFYLQNNCIKVNPIPANIKSPNSNPLFHIFESKTYPKKEQQQDQNTHIQSKKKTQKKKKLHTFSC